MSKTNVEKINDTTWVRKTTILSSFILGWLLTIVGFILPPRGQVDNSVLIILGQALTYTAVGVGLKSYVDITSVKLEELEKKNNS